MEILENHNLKDFTSIRIGGNAKYFAVIQSEEDLVVLHKFASGKNLPLTVIGRGTNTIFKDGIIDHVIGIMDITGIRKAMEFPDSVQVEAKAGEIWDDLVLWTVTEDLSGIEALSAIPGTVGAAPIQNIGAYGSELSDTFVNVRAYNTKTGEFELLGLTQCEFEYRDSLFKKNPGSLIVTSLTIEVSKKKPEIPKYKDIQLYFLGRKTKPGLQQIRKAIIETRKEKLPHPNKVPNAGSFFKNPILLNSEVDKLLETYPNMPHFKVDNDYVKIYAGWLIEKAGFKGKVFENVSIYPKNALVLTTNGSATYKELEKAQNEIIEAVKKKFNIILEREPVLIG